MNLGKKENTHDKTPAKRINELKKIIGTNFEIEPNGYLVCNSCYGYYKLKINESPEDFSTCECSGSLEYYETLDDIKETYHTPENTVHGQESIEYYDEYEELEQIVEVIKTKAYERKKFLENLSESITKQEKLLKEIKSGQIREVSTDDWSLWNIIEDKDLNNEIKDQKMVIDEIMHQENRLLSHVKEKRENKFIITDIIQDNYYIKIGIILIFMALIIVLAIYALK
ncbi:MAG: hypothetical protein HZC47_07090 [Methanobacterium sp.]|uniref:hypothetical protein n=1 Tax=Methanobacterium sp. TaxID=2164 RepID=UPI003D65E380|nr:hypothetical protein [Methanobacterium sp.]